MTVGIIVYSKTGHTRSVAELIRERLVDAGANARVELVEATGGEKGEPVRIVSSPDPTRYDALIFAAPVYGFALAPAMQAYFKALSQKLSGKPVKCFVTQSLPWAVLGGNRSVRQLAALAKAAGGRVDETGTVSWNEKKRAAQTSELVRRFGKP